MRRSQLWYLLYLILLCAAQAGCAGTPASTKVSNWIPGWPAKPSQTLDAQLSLGRLSERHGDAETAEQIYLAVLKKDPQNQLAHHRLGVLAAKRGQLDQAAGYLDAAAQLGSPSGALLNDIGFNLLMMDRLPEAEATFRRALEIDPQNRSAHNNLGLVLGQTGRYEESLAQFRQAGDEAEAQANLAYCKTRAGDLQGAKSAYHRALSLNQELKPAAEALMQLAQQTPPPERADRGPSEPKPARVSLMQGKGADFFDALQPGESRPTQAARAAWISAAPPSSPGTQTGTRDPARQGLKAAGQDASGFIPAKVFRFPEGSESTVATEIHRRQTPPTELANGFERGNDAASQGEPVMTPPDRGHVAAAYERPRSAVPLPSASGMATSYPVQPSVHHASNDPRGQIASGGQMPPAAEPAANARGAFAGPNLFPSPVSPTMQPWQAPTWTPDLGGGGAPSQSSAATPEGGSLMSTSYVPDFVQ